MDYPVRVAPEALEIANTYLTTGSIVETARALALPQDTVQAMLDKREVRSYVDQVFLDQGYRNRFKLFDLLDEIIESKLEEARESEMFTSKDLMDVLTQAHRMKMDELKVLAQREATQASAVNVQINNSPFGEGNYGNLINQLLCRKDTPE